MAIYTPRNNSLQSSFSCIMLHIHNIFRIFLKIFGKPKDGINYLGDFMFEYIT